MIEDARGEENNNHTRNQSQKIGFARYSEISTSDLPILII
jgi:hypothetical protein